MSDITLECKGLSKSFGGLTAVDDLSASFRRGRIVALIGPNGAGKTTLFHLIAGSLRADDGQVVYNGQTITGLKPWQTAARGIGRLFQDVRIFHRMTVIQNVLASFRDQTGENPALALSLPRRVAREELSNTNEAMRLLATCGLPDLGDACAGELSYGQQKLLAIVRLLAAQSDVLLLDEPTSGVNPEMISSLIATVRNLAAESKTIIIIEHNMDVVLELADWVYFMDEGRISAFGTPQDVLADHSVRRAYLGM